MNIQEIYYNEKNNFLFKDSNEFGDLRKNIIEKFDLSPKNFKNNESIKYADPKIFKFSYFYNNLEDQIHYLSNNDQDKINICVIDGKILNIENCNKDIDIKINNIESINTFIHDKFLDFEKYFDQDYIFNLNSLFLNSGFEMTIGEGQEVNIYISNAINKENTTLFQKNFIKCKKKSKINFIEEFSVDKPSNCNLVNFIDLEEGAELKHLNFQRNNVMANLQSTSLTHCQKDSIYKQVIANISYSSIRNHHYANINGEGVSVDLDGIFLGSKNQIIDNKTQVTHNFPNSNSRQRYKGVLTDNAKSSYLSKTVVDRIAQKTEAYQLSKGILLSDSSFFHSKPELKIYADDVKCSHGSTIGPLDNDLLFYLRSRGLSKTKAMSLLVKSFFEDVIKDTDNQNFINKFDNLCNSWLQKNRI